MKKQDILLWILGPIVFLIILLMWIFNIPQHRNK